MYVDLNNKTEFFTYIVTILQIVRSKSQASIHIIGYPYFILRIKNNQYKIKKYTFSYFSHTFLKCFKLDIFNLNYNQFFKEIATNINNICTSLINHFAKFDLVLKCFYLVQDKNLQTL